MKQRRSHRLASEFRSAGSLRNPCGVKAKFSRDESGQALVEFAIVVPLIIMVFMFSMWFTELVQIKLKVQEAARYAAWEGTAYQLHDYDKGPSSLTSLAGKATMAISSDTILRYSNMNSADNTPTFRVMSASWTPPLAFVTNQQEEAIPGGGVVNFIFGLAATVFDLISALSFKNGNFVAVSLVAMGKDYGGARGDRIFGSAGWGFNKRGYMKASVATWVTNQWFNRGVGSMVLPNMGVMIMESHAVLTDSWRLNKGEDVYGDKVRPGAGKANKTAYWKQVDRMYFVNARTRGVAKGWVNFFRSMAAAAVGFTMSGATPKNLGTNDMVQATVVSKNYTDVGSGQVDIVQDRGATKKYDTAPVCASCTGGDILKDYGKTLKDRGKNFMGCTKQMSLGCPSSSLSGDNPFGEYVTRE